MRFYLDTSVFGGYFDDEFKDDTRALFEYTRGNGVELIYSDITKAELTPAPRRVRELPQAIVEFEEVNLELIDMDHEAEMLAEKYIAEGALTEKCRNDARHIALATIHRVDTLVSWNFKHMVNFIRIRQYNAVNLKKGYATIDIRSPKEMILL